MPDEEQIVTQNTQNPSPYEEDGYVFSKQNNTKTPLKPQQYATYKTGLTVVGLLSAQLPSCGPYELVANSQSNPWNEWLQGDGKDPKQDRPLIQLHVRRVGSTVLHNAGLLFQYLLGPYKQSVFEEFQAEAAFIGQ